MMNSITLQIVPDKITGNTEELKHMSTKSFLTNGVLANSPYIQESQIYGIASG